MRQKWGYQRGGRGGGRGREPRVDGGYQGEEAGGAGSLESVGGTSGVMTSDRYPHDPVGGSTHWSVPEEHIAPRTISLWDRFLPRCFRRGCFLLRMELSPAKRPGQPAKCAKGAPETSAVVKFEPVNNANGVLEFRADWGAPAGRRGAQLQRTSCVLRGDSSKRAPSSTETSRSCVVKNSYPLTVPKCSPLPG